MQILYRRRGLNNAMINLIIHPAKCVFDFQYIAIYTRKILITSIAHIHMTLVERGMRKAYSSFSPCDSI